jgi:hypothetical protein
MAKDTIKLAGPDSADNYKVLATKGTLRVRPGDIYTERYVQNRLLDHRTKRDVDTSIITPKFNDQEHRDGDKFLGDVTE